MGRIGNTERMISSGLYKVDFGSWGIQELFVLLYCWDSGTERCSFLNLLYSNSPQNDTITLVWAAVRCRAIDHFTSVAGSLTSCLPVFTGRTYIASSDR